jgi:hypothetical protein
MMARKRAGDNYNKNVFINCPFDSRYRPILNAIVFTIYDCGFIARCALEGNDGAAIRLHSIIDLMAKCRYGIHDLSRTEADPINKLPRFNMPFELGIFLGARHFGDIRQRTKVCLVLDRERYRYQQFCSDIAGQDPKSHSGTAAKAIVAVRDWLRGQDNQFRMPSGSIIKKRYDTFRRQLPAMCRSQHLLQRELTYQDRAVLVSEWQKLNPVA